MVLKLYGYSLATTTKRVAAVLLEKNVPFELVEVDFWKNEHKSQEHLKKQPFGQIPCIDDDGFILYESRAISRYIATKYANQGTKLIPPHTDLKAMALFEQAASIEYSHFDAPALAAGLELSFKPLIGQVPDPVIYEAHLKTLDSKLEIYDQILSKQKYMAGDEFSLVDIFHIPYGSLLVVDGVNFMERRPNVARWFKDITSRPSWVAVSTGAKSTA